MKIILTTIYYVIFIAVIAVGAILVLPLIPIEGNIDTKVVLSGSMEPAIGVGSIIVIRPADAYKKDDIITFGEDTRERIPTTHRIVDARIQDGELRFTTKGDANEDPDPREITTDEIHGKVLFSMPYVGYLIDFVKRPLGFTLIVIIPASIIVLDELRKIYVEIVRMRRRKKNESRSSNEQNPFERDRNI